MRLTLRTLLAWMDDTLQPSQVREIGKQVADSPFAQELTERINRVTRQRRLSVPNSSGSDATDANIVAAYLDNDLDADDVAEFEKKCLTSDVNLAEAASVHQILSLLGQKVKVPEGARARMYGLVKGREAIVPKVKASRKPEPKEPVTRPIQPWVVPEAPKRPWIERYGPAAACLLLIVLTSWAAWQSLTAPTPRETTPLANAIPPNGVPAAKPEVNAPAPAAGQPAMVAAGAAAPAGEAVAANADTTKKAAADESARASRPEARLYPGSVATAEKPDGILLRSNDQKPEWERIVDETPLKAGDRVLCLTPFRAAVNVEKLRITLVGETEIHFLPRTEGSPPSFEVVQGRVVIRKPESSTFRVILARQVIDVDATSDAVFGMERVSRPAYGQPVTQIQPLGTLCQQGEVTLKVGDRSQTLKPMSGALVTAGGQLESGQVDALPVWLSQPEPSPSELQLKELFLKVFHADRPLLTEIVGALDDDRPEIKGLAVESLRAMGDLTYLMPTLTRSNDPVARRATIGAIRGFMMRGPAASTRVREELDRQFGEELGGVAHHMLVGYTPEELARGDVYTRLVGLLSPDRDEDGIVGIRELALDTLERLTGRDSLGYDPDHPAGKGYDAWNDLLRRNELRPLAPRPATAKTKAAAKKP